MAPGTMASDLGVEETRRDRLEKALVAAINAGVIASYALYCHGPNRCQIGLIENDPQIVAMDLLDAILLLARRAALGPCEADPFAWDAFLERMEDLAETVPWWVVAP